MASNIPSHSVKLSPEQQKQLGDELEKMGVHVDPKELKSLNMDKLRKVLQDSGHPEAYSKVMQVLQSFSKGQPGVDPSGLPTKPIALKPLLNKLKLNLEKEFGKADGDKIFAAVQKDLEKAYPPGVPVDPAAFAKSVEGLLQKHHVPQTEAKALAENAIQGESEGGLGEISSGGAETE